MKENAVFALLATKERREPPDTFYRNSFLIAFATVAAVSMITLAAMSFYEPARMLEGTLEVGYGTLQVVTWILSLVLLVGGAARQLQKDSSLFASFVHGQCMPEVLGTLTGSAEMVDGVARHSALGGLKSTSRALLPLAVLLVTCFPNHLGKVVIVLALWAPLTLACCWGGSYLASQLAIWNSQLRSSLSDSLVGLLTGLPAAALVVATGVLLGCGDWGLAVMTLAAFLLVTAGGARWVAIQGLERLPHLQRKAQQATRRVLGVRRNPWVNTRSDNPIVARETARDAASTPAGPVGWLLWRHGVVVFFLLSLWPYLASLGSRARWASEDAFWGFVIVIPGLLWFLAARRTAGAVVTEVENKTLDVVKQTRLRADQYVDGWIRVAACPRLGQALVLSVPLLLLAHFGGVELYYVVPLFLLYFLAPVQGAVLGLYASVAPGRAESQKRLSNVLFGVPVAFWFLSALVGSVLPRSLQNEPMVFVVLSIVYSVGYALFFRHRTLQAMEGK